MTFRFRLQSQSSITRNTRRILKKRRAPVNAQCPSIARLPCWGIGSELPPAAEIPLASTIRPSAKHWPSTSTRARLI